MIGCPMSRWLIRIGVACFILGAVLVSPLIDLLPVEVFAFLSHPSASASDYLFRVVPVEESPWHVGDAFVLAGLVLVGAGLFARRGA